MSVWCAGVRRVRIVLLAGLIGIAQEAAAQTTDDAPTDDTADNQALIEPPVYLPMSEDWDALAYEVPDGSRRCVARAIFSGFLDGEVIWVFNTASRETHPYGYLAIDPRLMGDAAGGRLDVVDGGSYGLVVAEDGYAYNDPGDSRALFDDMRQYYRMDLTIGESSEGRTIGISLRGFTRATVEAGGACGFDLAEDES